MKKLTSSCFVLCFIVLSSCKFEEENNINIGSEQDTRITTTVIEKEPLSDEELFITNLREGDEVYIEITGTYTKPKFSDEYIRNSTSTWKRRKCYHDDGRLPPFAKLTSCYWVNSKGSCKSRFRDYQGKVKNKIVFGDFSNGVKLSYFIGNKEHFIENNSSSDINILKTKITVTKDVVRQSDSFSIKAYADEINDSTSTGFLGYVSCAGSGRHHFNPNVSTSSQSISNTRIYNYSVTVRVRYIE